MRTAHPEAPLVMAPDGERLGASRPLCRWTGSRCASGGPTSAVPAVVVGAVHAISPKSGNTRQVSLMAPVLSLAETGTVQVTVQALGDENALGFSLSFDATKLVFTGASLASSAKTAAWNLNSSHANQGQIGLSWLCPPVKRSPQERTSWLT